MPKPSSKHDARARIDELRAVLEAANRAYYVDAAPVMSDVEFDRLLAQLADLEREHPDLDHPDSPTHRVGGQPIDGFKTVKHALPMLSIDNTYSEAEVREWWKRLKKDLAAANVELDGGDGETLFATGAEAARELGGPRDGIRVVCDPKIDGVAMSLRYEKGRLVRAVTRGDGSKGDDVTASVRTIRAVPLELAQVKPDGARLTWQKGWDGIPDILEVRGEVYFPLPEFARINAEREAAGEDLFMNPRNAAAGTLKQLDPRITASRKLGFMAHGRGEISDPTFAETHSEFLDRTAELGIPNSQQAIACSTVEEVLQFIARFDKKRHTLPYMTDGVVVRIDRFVLQAALGTTSKSPRWVIAYKYPAERKTTTLLRVDPQVGKSGKITPRAVMKPVLLAGTVVQHASLHNYGRVRDASTDPDSPSAPRTDIRIGDTVYVEKAGEIIPYVAGVVLSERPLNAEAIEAPSTCPICDGPVEIEYDQKRMVAIERFPKLEEFIQRDKALLKETDDPNRRKELLERLKDDERSLAAGPPRPLGPSDETALLCVNPECPAQIREKLAWFAGRRQMDIDGLGEKSIDRIRSTERIPLKSFADIFHLKEYRADLITMGWRDPREGSAEKVRKLNATTMVDNLLASIEAAKGRGLAKLLAGMGIRHVGDATAKSLSKIVEDIDDLLALPEPLLRPKTLTQTEARPYLSHPKAQLLGLTLPSKERPETGLGAETSKSVYKYLHSAAAQRAFRDLREAGVSFASHDFRSVPQAGDKQALAGRTFVITGTFPRYSRDDLTARLESLGAKVSSSVSSKTSVVVAGESPGSKLDKAVELGVEIWDDGRLTTELRKLGAE